MLDIQTAQSLLHRSRPRCSRDGYPEAIRSRVVPLVEAELAAGRTLTAVARSLGVHHGTLAAWLEAASGPSTFLPVVLDSPSPVPSPSFGSSLRVVSPSGYRIEGLDLEAAICVLRRLG